MSTTQLNAEFFRNMSIIAEDEALTKKLMKYLRKLVASKQKDSTQMTREEYFAKIERAEQQAARGEGMKMLPNEDLTTFLKRNGYDN